MFVTNNCNVPQVTVLLTTLAPDQVISLIEKIKLNLSQKFKLFELENPALCLHIID